MTLLARLPLPQALALLANGYLDEVATAARRLEDAADEEALHDTRVALRRLHSLLRAYRDDFAVAVPRKLRREVRRLARSSNPARDAEVQQAWLLGQAKGLTAEQQEGYRWLLARLQPAALLELEDALRQGVDRLSDRLRPHFNRLSAGSDGGHPLYVNSCVAQAIKLRDDVLAALAAIGGPDDACGAHKARILIKRLRYLLTPLRNDGPSCAQAVNLLRRLQELLGDLHDRHVLAELLCDSAAEAAADHARALCAAVPATRPGGNVSQLPGLLALAKLNHAVIERCHAELQRDFLATLDDVVRRPLAAALEELREGGRA